MKTIILFCLVTLSALTTQSQNIEGTYANKWVSNSGEGIEYTLTLNTDGQFIFDYIRIFKDDVKDKKTQVKGNWVLQNNLLTLQTETTGDNDLASRLDLNTARFESLSPRNPKFNLVQPSLKFYESAVFYAKDMELVKTEVTVTSN